MQQLSIALAQVNFKVGDIDGNLSLIEKNIEQAKAQGAGMVVFSELAITGYPPEDLLLRPSLQLRVQQAMDRVAELSQDIAIVIGFPWLQDNILRNMAAVWYQGQLISQYAKRFLPNYQVFDEERYFMAGNRPEVFEWHGLKFGLTVCEDIWHEQPVAESKALGADILLNLNASPFHAGKLSARHDRIRNHVNKHGLPVVYVNQVGGQDELVFDGASFVMNSAGEVVLQADEHAQTLQLLNVEQTDEGLILTGSVQEKKAELASIYDTSGAWCS